MKAAQEVGIQSSLQKFKSSLSENKLLYVIEELNENDDVDGILVQLPLPQHLSERTIGDKIHYSKDVDGFSETNMGRLALNIKTMVPCSALAVVELLKFSEIETFGKTAVVVGRSKNVGLPIAMMLHSDGTNPASGFDATVTICHRYTPPEVLKQHCLLADIIVSAAGVPQLIREDMVKPGATIIDVGLTRIFDPDLKTFKLVGDVDFEAVKNVAGHITPVPGGVGPMTVAMLLKNTFQAARNRRSS
jgi:methylenetetrahydrofolate dehydrogenase(NAD+)/5,10-methenyltetrahydrofolate cyclohydrolase